MIKDLFERSEKFPINIIYFFIEICFIIIGHLSILIFYLKSPKKVRYSVPFVNTVGDALEHIDYFRLKTIGKDNYKLLFIDQFPTSDYVKFLFNKKKYKVYNEIIYNFFLKILITIFDKKKNIVLRYKIIFQKLLAIYLSEINFYKKNTDFYNQLKFIKKSLRKCNKIFFNRFAESHIFFSKIEAKLEKNELIKKYGVFQIKNAHKYSKVKNDKLLQILKLKNRKFICLHIRNSESTEKNLRGSEDFSSYKKMINFFTNKNIIVVLMGNKNRKISNYFKKFRNVIDYRNSKYQTIINDLYLVNNSSLFITQISGPIIFPIFLGKPFLGIDLVTFEDIQLYEKCFYLPKKFFNKKNKKIKYTEIFKNSLIFKDAYFNREKYNVEETTDLEKYNFVKFTFNKILNKKYEIDFNQNKFLKKKLNIYSNFVTLKNINKIFFDSKFL